MSITRVAGSSLRWTFWMVVLALGATQARAAGTKAFRQTSAKEFEEGEAQGSQILPAGDVVPGLRTARVPLEAGFVWCSSSSPDGATAYFGTGDPGRLYAVSTHASGAVEAPARKLVDFDAPWVTALAVRPDGMVLAATTPGGRVFLVDPTKGTSREFAKLTVDHIWALLYDAKTKTTYAGTGGGGKIVAIDAQGKARVHWDSGDKHIVSLLDLGGGVLLAGTSDQALLYRVQPNGRAEALHDFDADEVRSMARVPGAAGGPGATYVAVNDFETPGETPRPLTPAEAAAVKGTKVVTGGSSPVSPGLLPRPGQVKAKAAVYRLEDDGRIEQVLAISDGYFTQLVTDGSDVYAAAGVDGRVYRLLPDRTAAVAIDVAERQALTLLRADRGFLLGTGDAGGLFRARPALGAEAVYQTKVLDAEYPARWGRVRLGGSAGLFAETRSGNTAKPDKNWSDWRKWEQNPKPSASAQEVEGVVASPSARYLQVRVTLAGADPVLRDVTTFYLPQNQRARVTELTLDTAGAAPHVHTSTLKLRWKVENPDGDELIHRLWYRQESEPVWRTLGGPDALMKPEYDWNSDAVPDGRYVVRVWTSDARAVAQDRALDSYFLSQPLLVDNTRPEVTGLKMGAVVNGWAVVTGRAADEASPVAQIEYAIDGGEWRPATPTDGLLDQRSEGFTVSLSSLSAGTHVLTVRAWDAADNVGASRLVFAVP